jgi:hypothetical protein
MSVDAGRRPALDGRPKGETTLDAPTSSVSTLASTPALTDALDWQAFCAAYLPAQRRHDLGAVAAYGAYRRSHDVGERSPDAAGPTTGAMNGAGSTALGDWEDEGGAAP